MTPSQKNNSAITWLFILVSPFRERKIPLRRKGVKKRKVSLPAKKKT